MRRLLKTLMTGVFLSLVAPLQALPLFETDSPLEIEITGPLSSLIEAKGERNEWPFRFKVDELELDMELKARGHSRMRVCDFPPLRVDFDQEETAGTVMEGQNKLKLVSPCNRGNRSEGDVLEEYLAYRIFGLLSDVSYRVRLVHITYHDTDGQLDELFRKVYGFLIEPRNQLTSRVGGTRTDFPAISLKQLDEKQAALMYVFQYLIANTDWSLVAAEGEDSCCHNVELIKIDSELFTVPYDFDLTGMANTRYARPDPSVRIKNVRVRKYRGFCTNPDVLRQAIRAITAQKNEIMRIISDLPVLTEKQKSKQVDYLDTFFTHANDEDKLMKNFEKFCHP